MNSLLKIINILKLFGKGTYLSLRLLIQPDNIHTLLKLGNLLDGLKSYQISLEKIKTDPEAKKLIEERFAVGFDSFESLKDLPEGSLGRAFYQHITDNKLSLYPPLKTDLTEVEYLRERQRQIHDILHPVFGLGISIPEEAQLNSILMASGAAPISTLIVAGSLLNFLFKSPQKLGELSENVSHGLLTGKQIRSPFGIRWEDRFAQPIELIKKDLYVSSIISAH